MSHIKILIASLSIMFFAVSCNDGGGSSSQSPARQDSVTKSSDPAVTLISADEELGEAEKEEILFLWEEEKLARDVYKNMYAKYGKKIFNNIANSEQQHMNSVKKILDRFKIPTPVDGSQVGNFKDAEIIRLYNELMERGQNSLYDAYRVGLDIELMDIEDLTKRIDSVTDPSMRTIYENLLEASYNHKAAFERNL